MSSKATEPRPANWPALTHPDKILYPKDHFTKADVAAYYHAVAPIILPYLKDRPLNLHRYPEGLGGGDFYERDAAHHPPFVQTVGVRSLEPNHHEAHYVLAQDEATLAYLVNIGCLELNPWNARIQSLDRPDYLVIDLDPEAVPFAGVVEAALVVKKICDELKLPAFCKTSGQRGLHIFVPLGARYRTDVVRGWAERLARQVHAAAPELTSLERWPAQRQGKVYLDYLQNRIHQSIVAAYSTRPVDGAAVSTPLAWTELTPRLNPQDFTIQTVPARLQKVGDLWHGVLGRGAEPPELPQST